jgi:hypothetical protein
LGGLKGKYLVNVINWVLGVVARETGKSVKRVVVVAEPPPAPVKTGLPLFDYSLTLTDTIIK